MNLKKFSIPNTLCNKTDLINEINNNFNCDDAIKKIAILLKLNGFLFCERNKRDVFIWYDTETEQLKTYLCSTIFKVVFDNAILSKKDFEKLFNYFTFMVFNDLQFWNNKKAYNQAPTKTVAELKDMINKEYNISLSLQKKYCKE